MIKATALMLAGMTVLGLAIVTWPSSSFAQLSDQEYARQALAAGPEAIAKNAASFAPSRTGACGRFGKGLMGSLA
jgi:hypothetical protein